MATVYLIFALLLATIAVIFAVQNTLTVSIAFMAWKFTGSLSLVLLATLAIGIIIGVLWLTPTAIKSTIAASGHRKRIGALEKELDEHKQKVAELQKPKPEPAAPSEPAPSPLAETVPPK